MSLTITLRVPDGIIIAADSLVTIQTQSVPREDFISCPTCKSRIPHSLVAPPPAIPVSVSPHGQKLFCLKSKNIGVATFGVGFLAGRTIESQLREFEKRRVFGNETVQRVAENLEDHFKKELIKEIGDLSSIPAGEFPVGLQVAGYDEGDIIIGKTYLVKIGKSSEIEDVHSQGYGCTFGGDGRVIHKLWKEDPQIPIAMPNFQFLGLQDAIDYASFLMNTTIQFQRFATMIPTCGGRVDIAVITHHAGFQWIQHKELSGEYS